jgi:hypothetical protein
MQLPERRDAMKKQRTRYSAVMVPGAVPNRQTKNSEEQERWQHGGVTLEEATRVLAYQKWERAGHPNGDGVPFWLEAEAELSPAG